MRHCARSSRAGMTLIEVCISSVLIAAFSAAAVMVQQSVASATEMGQVVSALDSAAWRGLGRVSEHLRLARQGTLDPVNIAAPFSTSRVDYQRVTGFQAGAPVLTNLESIRFEYSPDDPNDGIDNNGNGLIDEGRVVWVEDLGLPSEHTVTICKWVREFSEREVPGNGLDDNGNGLRDEAGFSIDYDGSRLNIRLSLERPVSAGLSVTRTVERTVRLRNVEP